MPMTHERRVILVVATAAVVVAASIIYVFFGQTPVRSYPGDQRNSGVASGYIRLTIQNTGDYSLIFSVYTMSSDFFQDGRCQTSVIEPNASTMAILNARWWASMDNVSIGKEFYMYVTGSPPGPYVSNWRWDHNETISDHQTLVLSLACPDDFVRMWI